MPYTIDVSPENTTDLLKCVLWRGRVLEQLTV